MAWMRKFFCAFDCAFAVMMKTVGHSIINNIAAISGVFIVPQILSLNTYY